MKKQLKNLAIALFLAIFTQCVAQTENDLNAQAFQQKIETTKEPIILDVREQDEAKIMGEIKNSIRIDYYKDNFETELTKLDPKKTYFVYCAGGVRSTKTCKLLSKKGFKNVYNLTGGFAAWESYKLPIHQIQ